MNIRLVALAVAVVVACSATPAAGQGQAQARLPSISSKPGSVSGRITAADTGRPLRRARITLRPVSPSPGDPSIAATTNSRGQYEAKNVPPGSYNVLVERAGYVTLQYGQRRASERGLSVVVRGGEATDRIDMVLPRGGVLAGTITDDLGEPYPGVRVDALALRYRHGKRSPMPVGVATTDDLGQFRISGLEPGRYYLSASSTETWRAERGEVYGYGSTFYPGAAIDRAEVIELDVSQVKSDLSFMLQAGRTARVSGRVVRENGDPAAGATIPLLYTYPGVVMTGGMRSVRTESDGSFEFRNVTAGVYRVGGGSADKLITVTGADIDGIMLVPKTGSTITGSVVTDEGTAPPFGTPGVQVFLEAPYDEVLPTVRVVSVDSDWSFKLTNVGGPFLFRLLGITDDWMLAAVKLDGKDIADTPWPVPTGGKEFGGLQIVVTRRVGRLSGVVVDANGKATSDASIVVFSEDSDLWMPASRFVRVARPDADGRFSLVGLPAGSYRAIARASIEEGEWEDKAFLEAAREGSVKFVLSDGGTETIALKLPRLR